LPELGLADATDIKGGRHDRQAGFSRIARLAPGVFRPRRPDVPADRADRPTVRSPAQAHQFAGNHAGHHLFDDPLTTFLHLPTPRPFAPATVLAAYNSRDPLSFTADIRRAGWLMTDRVLPTL